MRRVLIARQDSLGDVLLAGPAIRAVAAGGGEVTLLCGPRGRGAARLLPGVARVLEWRADWIDPEPEPVRRERVERFVDEVADERFQEALILTSFHQSPLPLALMLRMAGVARVAAICEDYPGTLLDVRHRVSPELHEVQRALSLAAACGYELPAGEQGLLRLGPVGEAHPDARALGSYVVVHPGASVSARAWPDRRHAELVELLVAEGHAVVVTGAPEECALTARVCGRPRAGVVDLGGLTDLRELAATIAGARTIVVGNTGPAHLAAAVGTPVVSLYAPTVPATRWRPWGVPHRLIQRRVPCAGCRARVCPVAGHPCMQDIVAEEVAHAVGELVSISHGPVGPIAPEGARAPLAQSLRSALAPAVPAGRAASAAGIPISQAVTA